MNKKQNIPAHYYNEAVDNIQRLHGKPPQSLDPQLPFALTRFEFMNAFADADYPQCKRETGMSPVAFRHRIREKYQNFRVESLQ